MIAKGVMIVSILIEGVKMPPKGEGNEVIVRIQPDGTVLDAQGIHLYAKAKEIPPHGRLIDGDALEEYCEKQAEDKWNQKAGTLWSYAFEEFEDIVYDRETIIEVEVGFRE